MALTDLTTADLFAEWRVRINEIIGELGDLTSLTTTDKTSLVAAINELDGEIGTLSSLDTTAQTDLVAAINEVLDELGDVTTLNTSATDAVAAVNEVLGELGDVTTLTTTAISSAVAAINELDGEIGDLSTLTTTAQGTLVAAINEVDGDVGDLSTLTTTAQGSAVAAINEVDSEAVKEVNLEYSNQEPNAGRFATDDLTTKAVTTYGNSGILVADNSASFASGEQFYDDNSTYGGAGTALGTDMAALMTALDNKTDRTQFRYGYEFYIMDMTAGAGTSDGDTYSATDYYPVAENSSIYLGGIGTTLTFMAWIRLETLAGATSGIVLGHSGGAIDVSIDDGTAASQALLTTGDGWVHMKQTIVLTQDYWQFFPAIYANSGDVINIAMPVLVHGDTKFTLHQGLMH